MHCVPWFLKKERRYKQESLELIDKPDDASCARHGQARAPNRERVEESQISVLRDELSQVGGALQDTGSSRGGYDYL